MKILFVSDNYPPYIKGGAEVSTSLLANWLSSHNNTVSVACSKLSDKPWIENGVTVYPIIIQTPFESKNFLSAIWYGFTVIVQQLISTIRVLKLARNLKPDIINVVPSSRSLIPIVIGLRIFSKSSIVVDCRSYDLICPAHLSPTYLGHKKDFNEEIQTSHGYRCIGYTSAYDPSFLSIRPFAVYEAFVFNFYKYSLRFLVNHSDNILLVGVSKYVQRQLILNGFEAKKTTAIYNISQLLEKKRIAPAFKIPTLAYGGRIENDKGIWDLIAATEILQRQLKQPFSIKIAGTGDDFNSLKKYIKEHDLDYITLLGHVKPDQILALYEESLAVIAPSRWPEPFGRFIVEAMSVGKPIIATRTGGITENIEDGVTGLLVDVGNAEQLAKAIKYFIENPERSYAMKDAIIEKQKYYKADFIGKQRLVLYESLLQTPS